MICIHKLVQTDTVNNNNTTEEQKPSNYKKNYENNTETEC